MTVGRRKEVVITLELKSAFSAYSGNLRVFLVFI